MSVPLPQGANPSDAGQGPGAPGGQVPPPSDAQGQVPASDQTGTQNQSNLTPEQMQAIIRQLRDNEAKHRQEKAAWEAAKREAELAQMSAAERAKAEAEDYKKQLETIRANARDNALEAAVALKARELGIVYPDLAKLAIAAQVSYGDNDKPQNVDELLRAFIQSHPNVTSASAVSQNTSIANAPRPQQGVITITNAQRRDMRWIEQFKQQHGVSSLAEAINKGIARFE